MTATASAICFGYSALPAYIQPGSAYSTEAKEVSKSADRIMVDVANSEALFGHKTEALSDLYDIIDSLFVDEDQADVDSTTLANASRFLDALPNDLSLPDISVDPDGSISFTWFKSRFSIFSAGVDKTEQIAYAWLDGSDKGHGVARFQSFALPARIMSMLRSIVPDEDAALGIT